MAQHRFSFGETVEESPIFAASLDLEAMKVTIGVRIYPHAALEQTAIKEGLLKAEQDLLRPRFYMAKGIGEEVCERVAVWAQQQKRPY